jgi:hypothetical protein
MKWRKGAIQRCTRAAHLETRVRQADEIRQGRLDLHHLARSNGLSKNVEEILEVKRF